MYEKPDSIKIGRRWAGEETASEPKGSPGNSPWTLESQWMGGSMDKGIPRTYEHQLADAFMQHHGFNAAASMSGFAFSYDGGAPDSSRSAVKDWWCGPDQRAGSDNLQVTEWVAKSGFEATGQWTLDSGHWADTGG